MKVHKTLKLSNSFSDNHASSSFFFSLTVKVLQNIVVDDRANSLSILFFVQGPSEGQPDCHSFLCVPRSEQKRGKSLSPFLESSSQATLCVTFMYEKTSAYLNSSPLNSKLNSSISRKQKSWLTQKVLSFQNGYHLYYLYRFYFISKPPFRIAKNWIHQFLTRRKQLVFGLKICHNLARCQPSFYLLDPK